MGFAARGNEATVEFVQSDKTMNFCVRMQIAVFSYRLWDLANKMHRYAVFYRITGKMTPEY